MKIDRRQRLEKEIEKAIKQWAYDPTTGGFEIYNVLGTGGVGELAKFIAEQIPYKITLERTVRQVSLLLV